MYTLILIAMIIGGSTDGGAHISVTEHHFGSLTECRQATKALAGEGAMFHNGLIRGGSWLITAHCFVRDA